MFITDWCFILKTHLQSSVLNFGNILDWLNQWNYIFFFDIFSSTHQDNKKKVCHMTYYLGLFELTLITIPPTWWWVKQFYWKIEFISVHRFPKFWLFYSSYYNRNSEVTLELVSHLLKQTKTFLEYRNWLCMVPDVQLSLHSLLKNEADQIVSKFLSTLSILEIFTVFFAHQLTQNIFL